MAAMYWRVEKDGEIAAEVLHPNAAWNPDTAADYIPLVSVAMLTWREASRNVKGDRLLKYAWEAKWPIGMTLVTNIEDQPRQPTRYVDQSPANSRIIVRI
jgi:hypothetical protein